VTKGGGVSKDSEELKELYTVMIIYGHGKSGEAHIFFSRDDALEFISNMRSRKGLDDECRYIIDRHIPAKVLEDGKMYYDYSDKPELYLRCIFCGIEGSFESVGKEFYEDYKRV
jgi:hypothetical protein